MKILLLGKNGQVGWELQRSLAPLGELIACDRQQADLEKPQQLRQVIQRLKPDIIVNAAAYTAVDKAESEPEKARAINTDAVAVLAAEAKRLDSWLVHYSTDYVFDGSGDKARVEADNTAPLNIYGHSKLQGELAIQASGCRHLIFRTSWVYAARGNNFVKTLLRIAKEREELRVVSDQIGAPTGAELIADTTAHCLQTIFHQDIAGGLYHLVASGATSWHNYARFVLEQALCAGCSFKAHADAVQAIASDEYPVSARRPLNSRLATQKLEADFGLQMPDWRTGVARTVIEIIDSNGSRA